MLLTNLLMHIPCCRWFYLWWRGNPTTMALLAPLIANPTRKQRAERCLWCWNETHHGEPYPFGTSSMCRTHQQRQRAALEIRRAERREELAV